METTKVFDKLYFAWEQHPRYISSCGGARSGKTFSALELLYYLASKYDTAGDITSVVSETFPHLKRGAIRDFKNLFGDTWDDKRWSKSGSYYTLPNGAVIEFFSADAVGKVHGPQRKRLFVNEVQNIKEETLRQLAIRTREIILLDYNPVSSFYVNEKIETRPDCITIHSTYKDNQFLSDEQVREIESNKNDENWWRVYGLGLVGQLEGLIFPDFEQVDEIPQGDGFVECYGLDFGFTNDPTTLVHAKVHTGRKEIYLDECCYQRGMLNADIAAMMQNEGVPRHGLPVYADCAEPKTIAELGTYGYNMQPCYKATKKAEQLQLMKGYKIFITKRSTNGIKELRNYTWMKDRNGNQLNEPTPFNDHFCDAARYAVFTHISGNLNKGQYAYGFGAHGLTRH